MQVDFKCPQCAAVIKAPPSLEGECSDCPRCKREVERWPAPLSGSRLSPAPPPPPDQAAVWFFTAAGKRRGPVTEAQLRSFVENGSLRPTDLIWREGMPGWVEASWLAGLFPQAAQPPAVPATTQPQVAPPPLPGRAVPTATPVAASEATERATKECPFCSESISIRAKRCPVCGETVDVAMRAAEEAQREAKKARREAEDARDEARRRPRRSRRTYIYNDRPRPTCPHALHLVLTVLTLGAWLPIWIIHWIVVEAS
ncbi:MAG: GYF domain-containing protein [Gemmataceae bacterium]|nr:GYF domain-containing protein [Gemmataceae bacterium]